MPKFLHDKIKRKLSLEGALGKGLMAYESTENM